MPRVLNVGQCVPDHMSITSYLRRKFDAEVVKVDSEEDALELVAAGNVDLVLVNRLYDADGASGLDTVKAIAGRDDAPPVMLVSNFADAQKRAVAAGALPGFGKNDLGAAEADEKLAPILGA
ncbi:DNA-binding transcriptional response regulator [Alienimonas californiensis]|uniref:Response regulator receiver domain protein n=1 Tax=Alienimonas californiensis TaxID=2527989 RepID=A0A517PEK6_9PLAN|nr:response regulator [Alienimonas californiensis]QDT17803.1 Response regulator receiver domain protein [Alienimonas californiensis]